MLTPEQISSFAAFGPVLTVAVAAVLSAAWVFKDAQQRGKNPWLVSLLVLFAGWPVTLVVWLVFRPNKKGPPPFNLEDFRVQ
jgi:hypothetical protein